MFRVRILFPILMFLFSSRPLPVSSSAAEIPFRHIVIDRDNPSRPHCKTVGDIDGDGFPDVLAASAYGQGLFWYAYPDWSKHRIDTGQFTTDMQAGDVDNDGDLDIIIPKNGVGLAWYENPRPSSNPATASWRMHKIDSEGGHDVEVGDIDGDGRLDVAVRDTAGTRVFLQTSADSWEKIPIPTGGRGGTALADLDGDGDLDILQNGYWLEAPEDMVNESWQRHEIAAGWPNDVGVHAADVNGDGRLDVLLVAAERAGRLAWYEASDPKNGPWTEHVIEDDVSHIHTFETADVDRDGNLDVVTAEMEQSPRGRVTVYFNLGDGSEWRPQVVGRSGSHNLRVADIGNDGDIDIIGANHGNHGGPTPIEMWENLSAKPAPALALDRWQRHVIDSDRPWGSIFIVAADLNGDGLKDVVTGGWWYQNPGNAGQRWVRHTIGSPLNNMAVVYDLNGDGHLDILGTMGKGAEASPRLVWARNDSRGSFTILDNIPEADGDFLQGVAVIRSRLGNPIEIALSWHAAGKGIQMLAVPKDASAEWNWRKIVDVSQNEQLSVGDIGRDVHLDLLLGTKWLRNDGTSWTLHTLNPTSGDPDRNRWADVNADGRLDAVVGFEAINIPGKLAWYEQPSRPTEIWPEHVIGMVVGPMSLDVADMNRDGHLDVVVGEHNYREPATARLLVFENHDGSGTRWEEHVVYTGDEHHDGAVVVDIDNDGDLDVISIGWRHSNVLLFENHAIARPRGGIR